MQYVGNRAHAVVAEFFSAAQQTALEFYLIRNPAFDALDMRHAAIVGNVGGLAGPRGNRAEPWNYDEFFAAFTGSKRIAIGQ